MKKHRRSMPSSIRNSWMTFRRHLVWKSCVKWSVLALVCLVALRTLVHVSNAHHGRREYGAYTLYNPSDSEPREMGGKSRETVVILVMPSPPTVSGPLTRIDRLKAISETWGGDFLRDAGYNEGINHYSKSRLVFVMEESDPAAAQATELWAVEDTLEPGGSSPLGRAAGNVILMVPIEVSQGGTDGDARMRYVFTKVARLYNPGFVFLCNEHTFVITENLQCFIEKLDASQPLYVGNRFHKEPLEANLAFNSGAAGFILSRASLALLLAAWGQEDPHHLGLLNGDRNVQGVDGPEAVGTTSVQPECMAKSRFERDNPGLTLARCLKMHGVGAEDTTDNLGGQRFNAYGPARLAQGKIDQWYKDVHASPAEKWIAGPGCCSKDTISFHYVGPAEARAMHQILHNPERYATSGYHEAYRLWPSTRKDLGGYAVAPVEGDETFGLLLRKIRLCES